MFVRDVRCCDLAKKFEGVSSGLKMVADCGTVERAADAAVNLISEHLIKVRFYVVSFVYLIIFCICH